MTQRRRHIHFRAFGMTDKGRVRDNNEDAFHVDKATGFFVVADGLGGHATGEIASGTAVETGREEVEALFAEPREEDTMREDIPPADPTEVLTEVVNRANRAVYRKNLDAPAPAQEGKAGKMGTTFVCAKVAGGKMVIANSGDSRCYHFRKGNMLQLTEDHSPAETALQTGRVRENDKELASLKRYVQGALGMKLAVEPDVAVSIPKRGDIYLLCTDGLTKMLADEKICAVIREEKEIEKAGCRLVETANAMGGRDNVTVVLVEITAVQTVAGEPEENGEETMQNF